MSAVGEKNYNNISEDEQFMNEQQLEYFRQRLLDWREQLLRDTGDTIKHLKENTMIEADIIDAASNEVERTIELRARTRQRKLINQIDDALRRINEGTYGYCEETGDPIGIPRLRARPIATLSIEAQERQERRERLQREE
ncbi:MAG: RNA polymerase-binding protein DksA [Alphaproteobacteria bacterium]